MKLFAFLGFAVIMTGFIYPTQGYWEAGVAVSSQQRRFSDFWPALVSFHLAGASAGSGWCTDSGSTQRQVRCERVQINAIPGRQHCRLLRLGTSFVAGLVSAFQWWFALVVSNMKTPRRLPGFLNTNTAAAGGLNRSVVVARILFGQG